jgi:hypothetical protein
MSTNIVIRTEPTCVACALQNAGVLDKLENKHIRALGSIKQCTAMSPQRTDDGTFAIELKQVSGLWYILAMGVGASALVLAAGNARYMWKKTKREARLNEAQANSAAAHAAGAGHGGDDGVSVEDIRHEFLRSSMLKRFVGLTLSGSGGTSRQSSSLGSPVARLRPHINGRAGHGAGRLSLVSFARARAATPVSTAAGGGGSGGSGVRIAAGRDSGVGDGGNNTDSNASGDSPVGPGSFADQKKARGPTEVNKGMDEALELSTDGAWGPGIRAVTAEGHGAEQFEDEVLRLSAAGLSPRQCQS